MFAEQHQSWIESANNPCGFSLNHLPLGAFEHDGATHLCTAIGDFALDLHAIAPEFPSPIAEALRAPVLNPLLTLGPAAWRTLRDQLTRLLHTSTEVSTQERLKPALLPRNSLELVYPLHTRGYIDFYASIDHARRVGELFRPDNPLLPNYRHIPIAYNGRASSLTVSGTPLRRPWGQHKPATPDEPPTFAPTVALDYEAELAFVLGHGNLLGEPISLKHAPQHLFGAALLNDWSARDLQSWEYQPLGPFLGKSFQTTLAAWITPMLALESFRAPARPRDDDEPPPLRYLLNPDDQQQGALDITVDTLLNGQPIAQANTRDLYWTPAQMLAHAASNGCPLEPGDLLATGTLSGTDPTSAGCLLELTRNGADPLTLVHNETRTWLQDGDEIILRARCELPDAPPITLGECAGRILAAHRDILPRQ